MRGKREGFDKVSFIDCTLLNRSPIGCWRSVALHLAMLLISMRSFYHCAIPPNTWNFAHFTELFQTDYTQYPVNAIALTTISGHLSQPYLYFLPKFPSKGRMAHEVHRQAKRANDNFHATDTEKFSKFGPRLVTMSQCSVALNDRVGKAHDRAQVFK